MSTDRSGVVVPAKLFFGLLLSEGVKFEELAGILCAEYGDSDGEFGPHDFSEKCQYYEDEMGVGLRRYFMSFKELIDPGKLAEIKTWGVNRESELSNLSDSKGRSVNLDPGLIMRGRMILATTKDFSHRVYLKDGIFAEVTLMFKKKGVETLPWTYPDYGSGVYHEFFSEVRARYEQQLNEAGLGGLV